MQISDIDSIVGKFNSMACMRMFINADECGSYGDAFKQSNSFKNKITASKSRMENKGLDAVPVSDVAHCSLLWYTLALAYAGVCFDGMKIACSHVRCSRHVQFWHIIGMHRPKHTTSVSIAMRDYARPEHSAVRLVNILSSVVDIIMSIWQSFDTSAEFVQT